MKSIGIKTSILSIGILLCSIFTANAQVDSAKAAKLKAQLIDTVCSCMAATDTASLKTQDGVRTALTSCMLSNGLSTFMEYAEASGISLNNQKAAQDLGMKVGMEMVTKCPILMKIMMTIMGGTEEMPTDSSATKQASKSKQ